MKHLIAIVEKNKDGYWARIEELPNYLASGHGENMKELEVDLRESVSDFLEYESKNHEDFSKLTIEDIGFTFVYDLQVFFEEFPVLKTTEVARMAEMNEGLIRQYASGVKHASESQAKKVESVIHKLASDLLKVRLA